jgi:RimJ/RimL family protein N-acetyltransferase
MILDNLSPTIQFCPLQESELARINELSNMPEIAEYFETIPPVSMEVTQTLWNYIQSGIVSLWGIHEKDQMIGGAGFYAQPPGTRLSHIATFFLYLEPAFWGKGIGRKAIQFLEDEVQKRGYIRMECMVADRNTRAIRLYERLGYGKEGIKKQAFFIDGEYTDLIIMGKVFSTRMLSDN